MNKYKCAKCGSAVFTADTLDKEECALVLCLDCNQTEEDLDNPEYHQY